MCSEGSVRKAGNRIRATAQLIEAETGNHVWAERFDRDLADIFALQDEITHSVVGAVEPEMQLVEGRRATRKSAGDLDAFDCCMRGVWHFHHLASRPAPGGRDLVPAGDRARSAVQPSPHVAGAVC